MKIRKGDKVVVLAGKDRGKEGEVAFLYPKEGKLIVTGAVSYTHLTLPTTPYV